MTRPGGADERTDRRAGSLSLHHVDRRFVVQASADGLAEIEAGKLAAQKGLHQATRTFGERMAVDHTLAHAELAEIARRRGLVLAQLPSPTDRAALARLDKTPADDFDRQYLRGQIRDHETAIRLYEAEVRGGRDAEVRRFAEMTLPKLREHLQAAREAEHAVLTQVRGPGK